MRHLLNTLFVTSEDAYLTLEGENAVVKRGEESVGRYPLHILLRYYYLFLRRSLPRPDGRLCQAKYSTQLSAHPAGQFLARSCGENSGNILLRRMQYRVADDPGPCCRIARSFIFGKVYNCRWVIQRTLRDHKLRVDEEKLHSVSDQLKAQLPLIAEETSAEALRGLEGASATLYFSVVNDLILSNQDVFAFHGRSRRPPMDRINALLSFVYTLLAHDCASALECVGLDSLCRLSPPGSARTQLAGSGPAWRNCAPVSRTALC